MAFGGTGKDIDITVKIDANGAVSILDKLGNEIKKIDNVSRNASEGFSKFQAKTITLDSSLNLLEKRFKYVYKAGEKLISAFEFLGKSLSKGSEIEDITESFYRLAGAAGTSGDVLISQFGKAIDNTIPQVEQMKRATELLFAGFSGDQIELVVKASKSLSAVVGGSAVESLDKLTDSLLRGNDKALKAIGITVDLQKAYDDFATSIGTTSDLLNEDARILATRNALLQELSSQQQELGTNATDAGDRVDQLTSAFQNQIDKLYVGIASNQNFNNTLDLLIQKVNSFDANSFVQKIDSISQALLNLGVYTHQTIDGFEILGRGFTDVVTGDVLGAKRAISDLGVELEDFANSTVSNAEKRLDGISKALRKGGTVEELQRLGQSFAFTKDEVLRFAGAEGLERLEGKFATVGDELNNLGQNFGKTNNSLQTTSKATNQTANATNNLIDSYKKYVNQTASAQKAEEQRKKTLEELKQKEEEQKRILEEKARKLSDTVRESEKYKNIIEKIKNNEISSVDAGKQLNKIYEDGNKKIEEYNRALTVLTELQKQVASGASISGDALLKASQQVESATQAIDDLKSGSTGSVGSLGDLFGEGLTGIFGGDFLGPVTSELAPQLGGILADSLGQAFQMISSGEINTGQIIQTGGTAVGGIVGSIFGNPIVGAQIGSSLGSIVGSLTESLFGGENAGTTARKKADKYFADLFDANRLSIIIDGQLKQISDLVFRGDTLFGGNVDFTNNSFSQFLESLPAQAQASFIGVGTAFETLLGIGEDTAGQLAAVFANNVGGELNNLQLLVYATGESFENLSDQIVTTFLNGNISVLEAQIALQGLQAVMEDGIPGAVGAIDIAFQNIASAGEKGGRTLLDAIQDVAFEAQELGIKDLPSLANSLVNNFGIATSEVQQFFQALSAAGITSLQQLAEASNQTLIAIGANLQQIQQGLAPTFTPVEAPSASQSTFTPSYSGGGGGGRSYSSSQSKINTEEEKRKAKRKQKEAEAKREAESLNLIIEKSQAYADLVKEITDNQLTGAEAGKRYLEIRQQISGASKELEGAEKKLQEAIRKNQSPEKIGQLVVKLQEAQDNYSKLTEKIKTTEKAQSSISKSINIDDYLSTKPVKNLNDIYDSLTKLGKVDLGDLPKMFPDLTGNTNELQVAILALGGSFEQMKQSAIDSFLAGRTSASEALQAIRDSGQGIPGIVGGVEEAFKNFQTYGVYGGRLTVDALRDISAEIEEVGGKSFDDIINKLKDSVSQVDLQSFFTQLQSSGVDTLEELKTVSDETAIDIIAGLEAMKFPFQQTSESIRSLLDEIDKAAQRKEVEVVLKVRSEFDNSTTEALASGITPAPSTTSVSAPSASSDGTYGKKKKGDKNDNKKTQSVNKADYTRVSAGVYRNTKTGELYTPAGGVL